MNTEISKHLLCIVALCVISVPVTAGSASAQTRAAELYSSQGTVESRKAGAQQWDGAQGGEVFNVLDAVRTAAKSRAGILFVDGTLVRLNESSYLEFKDGGAGNERPPIALAKGGSSQNNTITAPLKQGYSWKNENSANQISVCQ